jgi:branched-chain amino acid transport system ATP-binding protein
MLAVSRALLSYARVVLVDEPVQGMAPAVAERTYTLLAGLAADGAAVLLAEQQVPDALVRAPATVPVLVHELRRGSVVFSGEAVRRSGSH